MPTVGTGNDKKTFPYTPKGRAAAKTYAAYLSKKKKNKKKTRYA